MKRGMWLGLMGLVVACATEGSPDDLEGRAIEVEGPQHGEDSDGKGGDPQQALAERPPEVSKIEVELASPEPSEPALVFITYAEPVGLPELTLELDDGNDYLFNDTGSWPDEIADDGIYSGQAVVDLAAEGLLAAAYLDRVAMQPDPMTAQFDGRTLVGRAPFDPEPLEHRALTFDPAQIPDLVGQRVALFDLSAPVIPPPTYAPTHDWEKTLLIRDLSVVEDVDKTNVWEVNAGVCQMVGNPQGEWSFQTLMENIAHPAQTGVDLHDLVTDWVLHWEVSHSVQGDTVPAQYMGLYELWNTNVFSGWPRIWDDGAANLFNDVLDMDQAPFRLVAIVNRTDLRGGGSYGGNAGELRFVFEMIDPVTCDPRPFNVILEYGVPVSGCNQIRSWGQQWYDLDQLPLGSPAYNDALAALTTQVTSAGAAPGKPNGSAINQIRTNENFMVWPHYPTRNWQLREFRLDPAGGMLQIVPLVQTPAIDWEVPDNMTGVAPIDAYVQANTSAILTGTHTVVPSWGGQSPFQGAFSGYGEVDCGISPCSAGWNGWNTEIRGMWWGTVHSGNTAPQMEARHEFSLATCNGCHGREAIEDGDLLTSVPAASADQPFRHVEGHGPGVAATLSRFMTGTHGGCDPGTNLLVPPLGPGTNDCSLGCCPVGDPVHGYTNRQVHYADLLRRQADLETLVNSSCLMSLTASPMVLAPH